MGPLPAVADLSRSQTMEAIGRDKKVVAGTLHFVLPRSIGSCDVVSDVTEDEIMRALENLGLTAA
jgi:3-dehydroquinate synthase